jgi:DNA-binding FadR family transcriptional regulator
MPRAVAQDETADEGRAASGPGGRDKLAARIARAIEDDIIAAGWPVGSTAGSETELIERHGVSRAVFREAVRLVEHHQVAVMQRGRSGGLKVTAPSAQAAVDAAVVYLEHKGTTVDDLLSVRSLVEPFAAAEAARHITEADIDALRAHARRESEELAAGQDAPYHGGLHVTLARLSGNPVLQLFTEVMAELTDRYAKVRRPPKPDRAGTAREVDRAHLAIVDAVVAGDAATAQHYMSAHLEAMNGWFADTKRRIVPRRPAHDAGHPAKGRKLAEVIAEEIRSDIVRGRWEPGTVIDSETGLVQRYDVSRAAVREAVRLLEHHSVAWMRRGPGGGLMVAEPDLDAGVEAMALYLDYRGATAADLLNARKMLELGCVDIVTARSGEPEVRDRLTRTMCVAPGTPPADARQRADELHLAVAELTGNPVLVFLIRTITSLYGRHVTSQAEGVPEPARTAAEAVSHAHEAIVESVLAGDRGLARHRMTRHLDALSSFWH